MRPLKGAFSLMQTGFKETAEIRRCLVIYGHSQINN